MRGDVADLEHNMFLENMLDTRNLILGFAFGKLHWLRTAVQYRPIR